MNRLRLLPFSLRVYTRLVRAGALKASAGTSEPDPRRAGPKTKGGAASVAAVGKD